ncbi:uncharacterized protein SETTUDRAFT_103261 [Exserohilum turcica Et28A]|uniref:Carboxylic ester hydrolase n=1 Tax=Exserohilum turcicum (strain 28A) TaxID=671987 RepID=R0KBE9_EXST2|nr:uncharacterized protein SETTUDRAFT_103261 [Exserohilum turcica Et28A]EOA90253.1 hypothetical protein SETTUDRAFT_103261 [Exserohilum turcica Et28A]
MQRAFLLLLLLPLARIAATSSDAFRERCLAFQPQEYSENATLNVLQHVAAGTNLTFPDNDASCNRASQVVSVDLCRIALEITTSPTSKITFEAWLPEDWSGRFLATGNGGVDGCIKYEDIAYGAQNGFATVGTNNGHNGTTGKPFLNNAETVVDFAWRSLHTSVETGKTPTTNFYHQPHRKSYYMGCSLGGRQGIKSASRFPADFDGILAGAPAVNFNALVAWRARFFTITGPPSSPDFIPPTAWQTWIHDEILRQCDLLDKVQDGVIEDPSLCNFDPWPLHCSNTSTQTQPEKCLNTNQIHQLLAIFSPYTYPSGAPIYPAMQPGSEIRAVDRIYAGAPFPASADWFKYVVHGNPAWDPATYSYADAHAAERLNPAGMRTYPAALPAFERRGGKALVYHGQQDNQISAFSTNAFYEHLRGARRRTYADMQRWVRLFRISGMFHCSGGPGAWVLGQGGNAAQQGVPFEAPYNLLAALVRWVEHGVAPEYVEGTKFVNDSVEAGVDFTRRHCMYPARNTYVGGDYKKPESWECR